MAVLDKVIAAVFILQSDGSALLQLRDDSPGLVHAGKWTIPGGRLESGETPDACARREVQEETQYRCGRLNPVADFIFDDGDQVKYRLVLFWTPYDTAQTNLQCFEGQAIEFVRRDRVSDYCILEFLLPYWDKAIAEMKEIAA